MRKNELKSCQNPTKLVALREEEKKKFAEILHKKDETQEKKKERGKKENFPNALRMAQ